MSADRVKNLAKRYPSSVAVLWYIAFIVTVMFFLQIWYHGHP